jgi:hypothetical protein
MNSVGGSVSTIINVLTLFLVVIAAYILTLNIIKSRESFSTRIQSAFGSTDTTAGLMTLKPKLWWFVDDETNARNWWDFGARNSRKPNRGYLELALDSVRATQGGDFDIEVLIGRKEVSKAIEQSGGEVPSGVEQLPAKLWRQWALASLLVNRGGLAIVGDSVLCVGPSFGPLIAATTEAVFGIYPDEVRALPGSDAGPAPWIGWASAPHTTGWESASNVWNKIVRTGPTGWSSSEASRLNLEVARIQKQKGVKFIQGADGGRKIGGYQRTMTDLLSSVGDPALLPGTVCVTMDGDDLVRSAELGWFVRMSSQQILESKFVWAKLAQNVRSNMHKVSLF